MTENQEPLLFQGIKPSDQTTYKEKKKRSFGELKPLDPSSFKEKENRVSKPEADKRLGNVMKGGLDKWGGMPEPNYFFQLFSICLDYKSDKLGKLYGFVEVDGSGSDDSGFVSLFDYSPEYSKPICNKGLVPLSDPTAVSAATYVKIGTQLYVSVEGEDDEEEGRQVLNQLYNWNMSKHNLRVFDSCGFVKSHTKHGESMLYYVISKRAVEATMEISVTTSDEVVGTNVAGKIVVYYGNFHYDCEPYMREYYRVTIFEADSVLPTGKIPLKRSVMAVPYKSTLIIDSCLWDEDSGEDIINDLHEFPTQPTDSSSFRLMGNKGCYLDLKVHWKYDALLAGDLL